MSARPAIVLGGHPPRRRAAVVLAGPVVRSRAAVVFAGAVGRYWYSVYPRVREEVACQRRAAAAIPDPVLRDAALQTLQAKRANLDGAAAFAVFAPRARRGAVVRAQIAFQALYDYLDVLTERPHADPVANSRRLHGALSAALDPEGPGYPSEDGPYLSATVGRCREALRELPSYPAMRVPAARLAQRIVEFQSHNLPDGCFAPLAAGDGGGGAQSGAAARTELVRWGAENTPVGSGLHWWETAASAGSSLGLLALLAMAAQPGVSRAEAVAVEQAYFPWIGALHSLLDSLIDREEDRAAGQSALIEQYGSPAAAAAGLRVLAQESRRRAGALPHAPRHLAILAGMAGLYLAEGEARTPYARPARRGVLRALGALTAPALVAARLRRLAHG